MDEKLAITIWVDGSWRLWEGMDAYYAQTDPDYLTTIGGKELSEAIDLQRGSENRKGRP